MTQTRLFSLLRAALWGTPADPIGITEIHDVMALAKEHTVAGLIGGLVADNRLTVKGAQGADAAILEIMGSEIEYKRAYTKHCQAVGALNEILTHANIPYFIFKGTAAAAAYPIPHRRTMGDVDFYVPPRYFVCAKRLLEREWGVQIKEGDSEKHYGFTCQGIPFEMHHRVETFGTIAHQHLFDKWMEQGAQTAVDYAPNGLHANTLPPTEHLLVVFKHFFNHLLLEGVGLRQVVDIAVLMNTHKGEIGILDLRNRLKRLGYLRAFDAVVAMVSRFLALPCANRYAPLSDADYLWANRIMHFVLESGNFGRSAYHNLHPGFRRSMETAHYEAKHCMALFPLLPTDMPMFILRRLGITLRKNFFKHN